MGRWNWSTLFIASDEDDGVGVIGLMLWGEKRGLFSTRGKQQE